MSKEESNILKTNRNRVKGFLKAKGTSIVNEVGEEIILTGWGLGNWLLCEGYMWLSYKSSRFDRSRHIETVINELTGSLYAKQFWQNYREQYISKDDIKAMADMGYNSVRIPFNWRLFMEEEEEVIWKEEGFLLLDRCIDWCEEYHVYAFLDLHGAPGGQTGTNIDDSIDDVPRLFIDTDKWNKCIKLWEELAYRYRNRWIVGGYDLLNEPIRPTINGTNFDYLLPKLAEFYEETIAAIRKNDKKHMISLEGHHWATDTSIFYKKYDDNMILNFHRYGCIPDISAFYEFINVSNRLQIPLWLGETGENVNEWYTTIYPLAVSCGIGYNLWPWKKMNCTNSPCSIQEPDHWEDIISYVEGGPHPGYEEARKILDEFLTNMKIENCTLNQEVNDSVFRQPGCRIRATDFEHFPGKGHSYSGLREEDNLYKYRSHTGMKIIEISKPIPKFTFDSMWDRFVLELGKDEFAEYGIFHVQEGDSVLLELYCKEDATLYCFQEEQEIIRLDIKQDIQLQKTELVPLIPAEDTRIRIHIAKGKVQLVTIHFIRCQAPLRNSYDK
jgi:hypothetical protein